MRSVIRCLVLIAALVQSACKSDEELNSSKLACQFANEAAPLVQPLIDALNANNAAASLTAATNLYDKLNDASSEAFAGGDGALIADMDNAKTTTKAIQDALKLSPPQLLTAKAGIPNLTNQMQQIGRDCSAILTASIVAP